ncbi:hypothetical protein A3K80_07420 [Candidatus Bathyarchaeota archaeon RBG_13_38_9]|nr:MAG: hypothetical protein A3K80_07420 [Candidatus Bathyarchaeota archaeon RBG_13_38_9]
MSKKRSTLSETELKCEREYYRNYYKENVKVIREQQRLRYENKHGYKYGRRKILSVCPVEEQTLS